MARFIVIVELMVSRVTVLVVAAASVMMARPQGSPSPAIGSISSTEPVVINGTAMSPAAPSWPLAAQDEVATSAPAMLTTVNRDKLTLDANAAARINAAGNGSPYLYLRRGGVHFDTGGGPVYICAGGLLFIPARSAQGSLKLNASGTVDRSIERGVFLEQGTRACGPDVPKDFLSGLPAAAGGTVGLPGAAGGGIGPPQPGLRTKVVVGSAVAAVIALGFLSSFDSAPTCASVNGCNFNPAPISSSAP